MRPVRFVALSEDGQALILTDEVGRMLSLAVDENVTAAVQREKPAVSGQLSMDVEATLTPRDIQARIRSGDTAEHIARLANVPMEKILRFAGPVLQERAAMAQMARRTRLRGADSGQSLSDVADARLRSHGVDVETVAWDAYRRDDGGWRITATWPSGKATAHAVWDLDRPRSMVAPVDDMAQFLSAERQQLLLAQEEPPEPASRLALMAQFAEDADPSEGPAVPPLAMLRRRDDRTRAEPATPAARHEPTPRRADGWREARPDSGVRVPAARLDPPGLDPAGPDASGLDHDRSAHDGLDVERPGRDRLAPERPAEAPRGGEPRRGGDLRRGDLGGDVLRRPGRAEGAGRDTGRTPDAGRTTADADRLGDPARRPGDPGRLGAPGRLGEPGRRDRAAADDRPSRRDEVAFREAPTADLPVHREPVRGEDWRERLDLTDDPPDPSPPARARKADLPSWDDILFGSGSGRGKG